jgi:hypothetical protein
LGLTVSIRAHQSNPAESSSRSQKYEAFNFITI